MPYTVVFSEEFEEAFSRMDSSLRSLVAKKIEKIVQRPDGGKPLRRLPNCYAERVEAFRIVYQIQNQTVLMIRIGNRSAVYRGLW